MTKPHYDLVVIGSGPAGQRCAVTAGRLGKSVAIVDRDSMFGGVCLRTGGIPSKALREAVLHLTGFRQRPFYGKDYVVEHNIKLEQLMSRVQTVVQREVAAVRRVFQRYRVTYLSGLATFLDAHTLQIDAGESTQSVTADFVLIACGTRPAHHPNIPVDGQTILDTDTLLGERESEIATSVIVVGAGVVGLEYASMASALGMKTTIIDGRPEVLSFVDREIVEALLYHLRSRDAVFRLGEEVTAVSLEDDRVVASLKSGKRVNGQRLLYAAARKPNTDRLNLEAIGLPVTDRGRLTVNEHFQTAIPHIYAAGDVLGFPALASTSIEQGRVAGCHMFGNAVSYDVHVLPYGIYTIPEISMVGKTEQQLTADCVPYEIGVARFKDLAKGQLIGDETGMLKLIFDPETLKLLGVHIIGDGAAEILHIGHMAMMLDGSVEFLRDTVFNYPTMAEAYKLAADDGLSRLAG